MKIRTTFALAIALGCLQPAVSHAEDVFQLFWRGWSYTTTGSGQVVKRYSTEQQFINQVAANNNVSPSQLVFAYRPNKHDTVVAYASNGAFLADVYTYEFHFTDISNGNGTYTVRSGILNDEAHGDIGSIVGTEWLSRTASGAINTYSFIGQYNYQISETSSNGVYSGWFWTGKRLSF
jgi:hypothetical protein